MLPKLTDSKLYILLVLSVNELTTLSVIGLSATCNSLIKLIDPGMSVLPWIWVIEVSVLK